MSGRHPLRRRSAHHLHFTGVPFPRGAGMLGVHFSRTYALHHA